MEKYRKGIIAVIRNSEGQVLVCERSDIPGAWQFPQGGIEKGETARQAFFRELSEELGNGNCEILQESELTTRYEWPRPKKKNDRLGQEHFWFLAKYNEGEHPDLKKSDHCFRNYEWVEVEKCILRIVEFKRPSYQAGLAMLGLF